MVVNAIFLAASIMAFFICEWLREKTNSAFNRDSYTFSMGMALALGIVTGADLIREFRGVPLW